MTGSGCVVLFIAGVYLALRIITGTGPTVMTNFPLDFPRDIPQTNPDKIIKIVEVDATHKSRALWIATALPRLLASSVLEEINPDAQITEERDSLGRVTFVREVARETYLSYLNFNAGTDKTKTVVVTWNGIKAYPSILADNIEKQMMLASYKTEALEDAGSNAAGFTFTKGKTSGLFRAIDMRADEPGIEFVELIVHY